MLSKKYLGKNGITLFRDVVKEGKPNSYLFQNMLEDNDSHSINTAVEEMLERLEKENLVHEIFNENFITNATYEGGGMVGGMRVTKLIFGTIVALQCTLALALRPEPQKPDVSVVCRGAFYGIDEKCASDTLRKYNGDHDAWVNEKYEQDDADRKRENKRLQDEADAAEAIARKAEAIERAARAHSNAEFSNSAADRQRQSGQEARTATSNSWWSNIITNVVNSVGAVAFLSAAAYSGHGLIVRLRGQPVTTEVTTEVSTEVGFPSGKLTQDTKKTFKSFCIQSSLGYVGISPDYYEYYAERTPVFYRCEEDDFIATVSDVGDLGKVVKIPRAILEIYKTQKIPRFPIEVAPQPNNALAIIRQLPSSDQIQQYDPSGQSDPLGPTYARRSSVYDPRGQASYGQTYDQREEEYDSPENSPEFAEISGALRESLVQEQYAQQRALQQSLVQEQYAQQRALQQSSKKSLSRRGGGTKRQKKRRTKRRR